jgi:RES domain-containing protein
MPHRDWKTLLARSPKVGFKENLVRCISQKVFDEGRPPRYLFTSNKRNRCNPDGVSCLYMSIDRATAQAEYDKYFPEPQPHLTFFGALQAKAIVDLTDKATQKHFGIKKREFFENIRLKPGLTPLQSLGLEISNQSTVVGVRYPSEACHRVGSVGHNLVVYKDALSLPDTLKILGPGNTILEEWP